MRSVGGRDGWRRQSIHPINHPLSFSPPHTPKHPHQNTHKKQTRTSTAARLLAADEDDDTFPGLAYTRCHDPFTAASKSKAAAAEAAAAAEE